MTTSRQNNKRIDIRSNFTKSCYLFLALVGLLLTAASGIAQNDSSLLFVEGHSQYVNVPHSSSLNLTTSFTMEAWVNYSGENIAIIDKGNYNYTWLLNALNNANKMGYFMRNTGTWYYSTGAVPQGVNTHVAITLSGGTLTFYINGVASGTANGISTFQDNLPMNIGRQQPSGCQCNHFNGTMNELRIWNVARTQTEIQSNMAGSVPTNSAGLVAYYKLDERSGVTVYDATANANHGTFISADGSAPNWFSGKLYGAPGTYSYTVPAGIAGVSVQLWGAGFSSEFYYTSAGGAYTKSVILPVSAGQVYTAVVGATNAVQNPSSLTNAGASIFSLGATELLKANGAYAPGTFLGGVMPGAASTGPNVLVSYPGGSGGSSEYDGMNGIVWVGGGGSSGGSNGPGVNGNGGQVGVATSQHGSPPPGIGGRGAFGGRYNSGNGTTVFRGMVATSPGGGGAYSSGNEISGKGTGAGGWIIITECPTVGSIGVNRTVPFPYEFPADSVFNVLSAGATALPYSWEQSSNNSTWAAAPGNVSTDFYSLPTSNPQEVMYYRRKATPCGTSTPTNSVKITTWKQGNPNLDGFISGQVTSTNGSGVGGITITVQKKVSLLGSPITKTYTTITSGDGKYEIPYIFYGDKDNGDPLSVQFTITPSKENHRFNVKNSTDTVATTTLSSITPQRTNIDFTDNTVYAVTGFVTQVCAGCEVGFTTAYVDSVRITAARQPGGLGTALSYTGDGGFGKYGVTLTDPGNYKLTPVYLNHTFTPAEQNITVTNGDINNVNFVDNTVRTISGVFRAGGNQIIGTATLEFTDTVKPGPKFKKQVTTAADGSYTISLPARSYMMRVLSFNPNSAGSDIPQGDLFTFFNVIRKDSTISNLDSFNKTLNLVYHRKPVLQIINLPDTSCGAYVVFQQGKRRSFTVNVWEGDPSHNVKLASDSADSIKLTLVTSVQGDDLNDSLRFNVIKGVSNITLLPGYPNTVTAYRKFFSVIFTDRYGRRADDINRQTVVLGVKSDPGTFATVSPEIPLLILHDPPGDLSSSSWEQNQTAETAMRFSTLKNETYNGWIEAKLGVSLTLGLGVMYDTKFWASINANFGVSKTINEANEAIISVSNSQSFSTSDNSAITGDQGDVYVGAALNLLYSVGHELKYMNGCTLGVEDRLMIADSGFATKYVYSESHIVNTEIPRLQLLANGTTGAQKANFENQINVWRQVLANNAANKAKAVFDKNISFDGVSGPITESTTASSTKSQTIEFNLEVNTQIAIQLGLEIAGSGVSGGVNIGFKMETGESKTTTATKSTTVSYTIDDDDPGDNFTVDIKKDPVYGTPVFVLVAGSASCPDEPIAQKRDNAQLLAPNPVQRNIPPTDEAIYELQIGNTSESMEPRTYLLSFDQSSNPFPAATITINGSPAIGVPVPIPVSYGDPVSVTVGVKRNQSGNLFSYEGLRFVLTDACGGSLYKVATVSAYFATPCSGINITSPTNTWQITGTNNNSLPVQLGGYNTANLQSISLEHSKANNNVWVTDTTVFAAQITGSITPVTFKTHALTDGAYDLRAKVTCSNGITYSQRITGTLDRTPPLVFGNPEPTDDNYTAGDLIAYTYSENIETLNLNTKVELRRMSNNAIIPIGASGYMNKIMIVPTTSISSFTGDTMRLIMHHIADAYGNARAESDTTYFVVGTPVTNTNPALTLGSTRRAMNENAFDSLEFRFTLPSAVNYNRSINYVVSGTATYGVDYTVRYPAGQPPTTTHSGVQGTITVLKNTTLAVLRIKPIADSEFEPAETITVTLAEGGNYSLGATLSLTDTIRNDDLHPPVVYKSGPIAICLGQTLTLSTDDIIDGQPVYAYQWKKGTTVVGSNPTLNVTSSGVYSLTVFTQNGFTGLSESIEVTVSNVPGPSLGADVNVYLDCYGDTKDLSGAFNTTGFTTTWSTPTPGAAPAGVYRVVAANNAGCTDTAYANVVLETAVWTGTVSSNWHTPENWNIGKVPTNNTHVIVSTGTPNVCTISNADASAASVQIRNGATVNVINNRRLNVGGKCLNLPPN
ncbi:MAG: hypothetical protein EOO10_02080 [Chitinophagaceae bacterium]|nr:MAG: hypothetical protein EOO10_02080 [Chitinophagaceae bacterium]